MISLLLPLIYLAFISLGVPDGLLGAAWPAMQPALGVPLSYAGVLSMIIAIGTIVSSLQTERLSHKFGTGGLMVASVSLTALALLGFAFARSFPALCLLALPYGLGAGSVDAGLNNYVALYYESKHMSWLHCMWGVGASIGPYVMGGLLAGGAPYTAGYRLIGLLQIGLSALLLLALPLFRRAEGEKRQLEKEKKPLSLPEILRIPGAKAAMLGFFCYCGVEQTAGLWAASYLSLGRGVGAEQAASLASLFFLGITAGRGVSGFLAMRLRDDQLTRLGLLLIGAGVLTMLLPARASAIAGLALVGLGCAPIFPAMLHETPARFGAARSEAMLGVQMASAYVGTSLMPPLFGALAQIAGVGVLPLYLLGLLLLMGLARRIAGKVRKA